MSKSKIPSSDATLSRAWKDLCIFPQKKKLHLLLFSYVFFCRRAQLTDLRCKNWGSLRPDTGAEISMFVKSDIVGLFVAASSHKIIHQPQAHRHWCTVTKKWSKLPNWLRALVAWSQHCCSAALCCQPKKFSILTTSSCPYTQKWWLLPRPTIWVVPDNGTVLCSTFR